MKEVCGGNRNHVRSCAGERQSAWVGIPQLRVGAESRMPHSPGLWSSGLAKAPGRETGQFGAPVPRLNVSTVSNIPWLVRSGCHSFAYTLGLLIPPISQKKKTPFSDTRGGLAPSAFPPRGGQCELFLLPPGYIRLTNPGISLEPRPRSGFLLWTVSRPVARIANYSMYLGTCTSPHLG